MDAANKHYLGLNDISAYKLASTFSNQVWDAVAKWDYFAKDTLGKQFCRAADSISANIAEGFGRFGTKEKIQFYRIAKGSAWECLDCNEKGRKRRLLPDDEYRNFYQTLRELPKSINHLIKFTESKLEK